MTPAAAVAETHSAVVFFFEDRAYKVKKPVDLGFLDFRTREARQAVCRREVELNRRLAADVYLGVADVTGPDGELCDHLVVMKRLPDDRRLSTLVIGGEPVEDHLRALARLMAALHSRAARTDLADECASAHALAALWQDNTASLLDSADGVLERADIDEVDRLAARYLRGRRPLFESRIADGRACDGHGDLQADDVFCLDDGPRAIDCLEFEDRLRCGDGLGDVAFLAMDLEHLGRADLAALFLTIYRELAGDSWPASLVHHHVAYRAHVRAKVMAIRASQGAVAATDEARSFLALARRRLEQGRVRAVLVGGLPGTGKSTLAAGLGEALGATVLRSDTVRKELAGLAGNERVKSPYGQGLYQASVTEATYGELLRRARVALDMGESVVLDASWLDPIWRERAASLAVATSSEMTELCCVTAKHVAHGRLRQRLATGDDPSDATPEIYDAMVAELRPWPVAERIDTGDGPNATLAAALSVLNADVKR
jgi:hypothetical protein